MGKIRRSVLLLSGVYVAVVLVGCGSSGSEDGPTPSASVPGTTASPSPDALNCADRLTMTLETDPEETKGVYYLSFENAGQVACKVVGFPEVSWVSPEGTSIETSSESDAFSVAGDPVSIDPGSRAYVWLHVIDSSQSNGDCLTELTAVPGLGVMVPGASAAGSVALAAKVCSDPVWMAEVQVGPFDAEKRAASKGY